MNRAQRRRYRRMFKCEPPAFGRDHRCQDHMDVTMLDGTSPEREFACPCGKTYQRVDHEGARWWSPVNPDGSLAAPPPTDRPAHLELLRKVLTG